ncbi:hypothetical protein GCM10023196_008380 [Actinoallomurus vinaceus]|uniref:Uncharacterized protein n=1 Tax=Actinoallomurus vinaceus TaxID=1080074 RepID=A0ABP8U2X1_9ACTN
MDVLEILAEFGATGRVGLLSTGADLRELVAVYGMPWDVGRVDKSRRWPHLYAYGDVEFVVCRCRIVASITVPTWRGSLELPTGDGRAVVLPAEVTYAQVVDALAAVGCAWEPLPPIPGQCGLRTCSREERIDFTFTTDDGPEPVLHGAGTWYHAHGCIPVEVAAARFPDDFPAEQPGV